MLFNTIPVHLEPEPATFFVMIYALYLVLHYNLPRFQLSELIGDGWPTLMPAYLGLEHEASAHHEQVRHVVQRGAQLILRLPQPVVGIL